jgi:hypothetical protein
VITEYNNYYLDYIGFWRGLEYVIYLFTGIKPSRKPSPDEYSEIQTELHNNAKLACPDVPTMDDIDYLKMKLLDWKKCQK